MNNTESGYSPVEESEAMPQTRVIRFKDGEVEIPTAPLCSIEQIHAAEKIVEEKYPQLVSQLPEWHAWAGNKAIHEIQTQERSMDILEELGFDLNDPNARLVMFIAEIHDLGRVIDGLKKEKIETPPGFDELKHHGQYSVKILENWQVLEGFPPETQEIIKFAVLHHAEKNGTELPENATDKEKTEYVYNTIFRDLDKLSNLVEKTDKYLYDPKTRDQQFNIVEKILEKNQEEFLGETGQVTPEALALFLDGKLNDVHEFYTYETYMLNTLGFIFNINLPAVLKEVVGSGVINKFLDYFKDHLSDDQYQQIENKVQTYLTEMGLRQTGEA